MSGPKYYNFPMSSPEEAAKVYSELSAFRPGVRVRVVNNELQFTVSNSAWSSGINYSTLSDGVNNAKARYLQSEEMKRILEKRKSEEKAKISNKKSELEASYRKERAKLEKALTQCRTIEKQAQIKVDTPFGTYGLPKEAQSVSETVQRITSKLSALETELKSVLRRCDESSAAVENCSELNGLTSIQKSYNALNISESSTDRQVEALGVSVQKKIGTLKSFVGFLEQLYNNMKNKDLSGYFDRIKAEVSRIDIFDKDASEKINAILSQIEKEIEGLRMREKEHLLNAEIRQNVNEQIGILTALKTSLQPVIEGIDSVVTIRADYTQKAEKLISDCEGIISEVNNLEFVSGDNAGRIEGLQSRLNALRNSVKSENTVDLLNIILRELHETEKACKENNDTYKRFKAEQERYYELYLRLQGVLCADGAEISADASEALVNPSEMMLVYGDPEKQIAKLRELNNQLSERLSECFQTSVCAAFTASVDQSSWGEKFKQEKHRDGSMHMAYVRKANKGAIFDVSCDSSGRVGIYPRGVVLCNGKTTITPEGLRAVHSSCTWADEITEKIRGFGVEGTSYEEMPEADLKMLYDIANYYHIDTLDESIEFLRLSGFSEEEINGLLELTNETPAPRKKDEQKGGTRYNAADLRK